MPNHTKSPPVDEDPGPARMQGRAAVHLHGDAAERNRRERALRASEIRYRRLFEAAPSGIFLLDGETGVVTDANQFLCGLLGYQRAELVGHPLWELPAFRNAAASRRQFRELLSDEGVRYPDLPLETRHGQIRRVDLVSTLYLADGHPFVQCHVHDITDRIKEEQGARQEQADMAATITALRSGDPATHDALTGLVNAGYLDESLPRELHRAQRGKIPLTVALLDLDRFARINDGFGRGAGDAVLLEVSRVLREHLRKSDTACRLGDDDFAIVLPQSSVAATVDRVEQIRMAVKEISLRHGDRELDRVTVSAGIAAADERAAATQPLLTAARAALTAAKRDGGDRVVVHHEQERRNDA